MESGFYIVTKNNFLFVNENRVSLDIFISKVETLVKESPPQLTDPIPSLKAWISGKTGHMALSCVHPDQVIKIIGNHSNSAAFGLDEIDTSTLKLITILSCSERFGFTECSK